MKRSLKELISSPTAYLVVLFLVLFIFAVARDAEAQEFTAEVGGTFNQVSHGTVLWFDNRWLDAGPGDADIAAGAYLITSSTYRSTITVPTQSGVYMQIVDHIGPVELGFGVTYQKNDDIVVSDPFRFSLLAAYTFYNDRWYVPDRIGIRHHSNGSSGVLNSGWDWLFIGWSFQ